MAKIRIGLAGCGFVSELHMHAYKRVYGVNVEVRAVAARGDHVVEFARRHQIPTAYRSFRDLIADADIDVIDICTPPNLHTSMIVDAMQAGKHVICEKPFGGYFGREGDKLPIGKHVSKALMYERVLEEMEATRAAINKTGRLFMYAEDWIYAPAVTNTVEILKATQAKIFSGDMILGGVRNLIETYTSGGALFANITPNTHMMSYQTSEEKLASVYITEKVDRKTGWQYVCLEEEWTRGYVQEIQDFMECVATGRQPLSDLALAFETIKVNYAGYWAAEEGRRVTL